MVLVAALVTVFGVTSVGVSENAGAAQTTCPSAIGLSNGDFENPTVPAGAGTDILDSNAAAIWKTTATDHNIEYWRNGGSSTSNNGNLAITAESGSQWVELNATQASTLYQDLTTVPGQVMRWSLWHRARYTGTANGQDVMAVKIGTTTTQVQQGSNISDGPNAWVNYTGSYTVPAGQTTTRFAFTAVSTSSGNATIGNFLDNVQFSNAPCLTTSKTVTDLTASSGGLTRPGDTLQYTVTVNNTGGAMSSNDVVTDAIPANTTYVPGSLVVSGAAVTDATDTDVGQFSGGTVTGRVGTGATSTTGGTIAAGGTTTMTFKVTVNAGTAAGTVISNTANTTYQWAPAATTYTSTTNTLTNTVATTGITVAKSVSGTTDVNGDSKLNTGDKVAYTFLVTNTGSTALTAVGVNDSKATVSCPSSTLASGASETCTATYTVTQADVDSGSVVNTATATGTPPSGASAITSAPSTATKALDQTAALTLTKSGASADTNGDGKLDVGDKITYSYLVKNTGSVTLNPVSINDAHSGLSAITCPTTSLAALATTTCTATYPITQADLDAGVANNTATASGKPPTGASVTSAPSTAAVTLPPAPALTVTKSATSTPTTLTAAGQTVAYSFLVKNTGNVTVTGIAVADTFTAPAGPVPTINCPVTTLAPGASTTCTAANYAVTQADVDNGKIVNSATVSGKSPAGATVTSAASAVTVTIAPAPAMTLQKTVASVTDTNADGVRDAGDKVNWTFKVTNTGNVTLNTVAVSDAKAGAVTCSPTTLAPGASVTCTAAAYPISQAEGDAGLVTNTATSSAKTPAGAAVTSPSSSTSTTLTASPKVTITKSAAVTDVNADGKTDLGDKIQWSFLVKNTGNVTLTGVAVSDAKAGAVTCPATTLAPGVSTTCTATTTYTISQTDVDSGSVTNTATATATPPSGSPITSAPSSTNTPIVQTSALQLTKSAVVTDVNHDGLTDLGDTVAWSFAVKNTGTTSVTALAISDPTAGATTCAATSLAPGASTTCTPTAGHTITQADVDAGFVTNTATAAPRTPRTRP